MNTSSRSHNRAQTGKRTPIVPAIAIAVAALVGAGAWVGSQKTEAVVPQEDTRSEEVELRREEQRALERYLTDQPSRNTTTKSTMTRKPELVPSTSDNQVEPMQKTPATTGKLRGSENNSDN